MPKVRVSHIPATQEAIDAFRRRFACRRCGACCNIFEGIKIPREEADSLPLSPDDRRGVAELFDGTYFLKEPCPFYSADIPGCGIYDGRPATCRSFPLYNQRCDDGRIHLGAAEMCPAAVEALAEMEKENAFDA